MFPKPKQTSLNQNLNTSIYDWDSPSSSTGTVKRRPLSCSDSSTVSNKSNSATLTSTNLLENASKSRVQVKIRSISSIGYNNNTAKQEHQKRDSLLAPQNSVSPQEIQDPSLGNSHQYFDGNSMKSRKGFQDEQSREHESSALVVFDGTSRRKSSKLRFPKSVVTMTTTTTSTTPVRTEFSKKSKQLHAHEEFSANCTELFNAFPKDYCHEAEIETDIKSTVKGCKNRQPQIEYRHHHNPPKSVENDMADNDITVLTHEKCDKSKSPYRGRRVSELKTRISKINNRAMLSLQNCTRLKSPLAGHAKLHHDSSNKSTKTSSDGDESAKCPSTTANDYIHVSLGVQNNDEKDDILCKPEFSSSQFKNIPVRKRKGGVPHLENYYLFDPSVDFINEKDVAKQTNNSTKVVVDRTVEEEEEKFESVDEIIYTEEDVENFPYHSENRNRSEFLAVNIYGRHAEDFNKRERHLKDSHEFKTVEDKSNHFKLNLVDGRKLPAQFGLYKDRSYEKLPSHFRRNQIALQSSISDFFVQKNRPFNFNHRTIPSVVESNYVLFQPGPVPSRNMQYKIRKPRPLSTHSDADSGFLSPATPEEPKFNPTILVLEQCDNVQGYIEIYTDWANFYLERSKSKKRVTDLSADCRDGLLLAEVIEAVTSFKVSDLSKKPKSPQQMFDNVDSCLNVLRVQGVGGLDTITTNDICNGRLKAVLALFFALSRFKQQNKQQKCGTLGKAESHHQQLKHSPSSSSAQQQNPVQQPSSTGAESTNNGNDSMNRQISYSKVNGGTAIPLPATVLVQRRCPPDKVRPLPPTPNHVPSIPGLAQTCDSRSTSPQSGSYSMTQVPKAVNGLRQPQVKITGSPYAAHSTQLQPSNPASPNTSVPPSKHSMLDKLKLFNKDKSSSHSSAKSQGSKRTSSSSGFSSARSERSDSSLSLNDGHLSQIKPPTNAAQTASTSKKSEAKSNIKQMKLLHGTTQKISGKHDKKEKSPARKVEGAGIVPIDEQKFAKKKPVSYSAAPKCEMKDYQCAGKLSSSKQQQLKPESRSESKSNLSIPTSKSVLMTSSTTGIPKPMAAIKGTSKSTSLTKSETAEVNKNEKIDISDNHISEMNQEQLMHIVNPGSLTELEAAGGAGRHHHQQQHNLNANAHFNKLLQANSTISISDSLHSSSTQSGGLHSNSSESSVIYRPNSESGSEVNYPKNVSRSRIPPPQKNIIPNRKYDTTTDPLMQSAGNFNPNVEDGTEGAHKFHTAPSKIVGTIYEEDKPVNVLPMRPLLRGYNSHVTLPTRGGRGHHYLMDYCGESDTNQGYCSDGDALRLRMPTTTVARFSSELDNGYLSEGGGGGVHGKSFLSLMRARTQLPTTIEERTRSSHGSLDSIGTTCSSNKMEISGRASSTRASPARSSCSGNDAVWLTKMPQDSADAVHMQQISAAAASSPPGRREKSSPSHSRRNTSGTSSKHQSSSSSPSRAKNVPQSFGYVKRSNGLSTGTICSTDQQNILLMGPGGTNVSCLQQHAGNRTAHVSAVPRSSKMKVSGGTQTCTADLQTKIPPNTQHRSFSLTGPGATQLSQSIRERLSTGSHSLPKPGSDMHVFHHRITTRGGSGKILDGSLSDTQTYAEVKPEYSTYAMWLKHSNTAGSRLSEGDSLETLQIGGVINMARQGHKLVHRENPYNQSPRLNRSNSIRSTKSEKMYPSMLSRGPDVEIEPYYCLPVGTIQHHNVNGGQGQSIPWSQPTSPTPQGRGFCGNASVGGGGAGGPLSPTHSVTTNIGIASHRMTYPKKNDEVHGSAASLLSGGSSLYGSAEERQANEVRRLKRELADARDQVMSLSSQLSTNAHVVAAFEQSLSNMTQRLQQLTATAERKDSELTNMRQTIELLRKQSIQAGLTTAHMQSMGVQANAQSMMADKSNSPKHILKQQSQQQISSHQKLSQQAQQSHQKSGAINNHPDPNATGGGMQRHHSSDSMCSLNSISSGCSSAQDKKKKKGWLRSSFTKAFSRNAKISKTARHVNNTLGNTEHQSVRGSLNTVNNISNDAVVSAALPPPSPTKSSHRFVAIIDNAKPIDALDAEGNPVVEDLKKQLREKDLVLTDIRLEALSSASQLENLKDTVMKMRAEMMSLKQNNERLQKLVTSRSLAGSEASLGNAISPNGSIGGNGESRRYSLADSRPPMDLPGSLQEEAEEDCVPPAPAPEPPPPPLSPTTHIDLTPPPPAIEAPSPVNLSNTVEDIPDHTDGKKIAIAVYLGQPESFAKYAEEIIESDLYYSSVQHCDGDGSDKNGENEFEMRSNGSIKQFPHALLNEFIVSYTYISGKTSWQNLDYIVRKTFKDYVSRIDPGTNLGLNTDSITSYHLGEAKRGPEMGFPELLPCGYIVGNVKTLYICLQGVGSLAFDSLIPRSIVHRYISLLTEHRRLILCGPSGTGKSYLARKLAEFLVVRSGRGNPSEAIATFNVDHKSSKELRQYLSHVAEQASIANGVSELPSVIILDNLHHVSALGDVFSCLLSAGPAAKLPCIIGTMSQATCNTTNLQLHHNFRWVLTANHMEPVKGFLARFLRRRQFGLELSTHVNQPELASVLVWLPTVWQHINRFLENHSSSDVTIGPRLFLSCPLDLKDSQVWFTDVWNYHLAPYLVEAVREGVQLYGRRGGAWCDPSTFIRDTYPWPYGPESVPPLRQINAEDVGLEAGSNEMTDSQDPLLNMLMRLQEAANYSGNQEHESDCASLDSNITPESSAGAE